MGILANIQRAFNNLLMMDEMLSSTGWRKRVGVMAVERDYYDGTHKRQLTVRPNQADDNLTLNFVQLVVERSISLLLGGGVEFEFGETGVAPKEYIDQIMMANNKDILLHKAAQFASINGTGYFKIIPDGTTHPENPGTLLPRIVPLDPLFMSIETDAEDIDSVARYVMRWNIVMNGKDTARKEVTERAYLELREKDEGEVVATSSGWVIRNYKANADTLGKWELMSEEPWEWDFPPVVHWQNLPNAASVYGRSDVGDLVELNDRVNFVASNISKIIRYHAHPKTWARGFSGFGDNASWGADELVQAKGENAHIENLEMQSDLMSSQMYLQFLRQALFDIGRTVDITSFADKLGALTNFGLRVLFMDSISKLNTKQALYGEAMQELNRRLLEIDGQAPINCEVVWGDILPEDEREEIEKHEKELALKLVSKQTVAERRGYDWEREQERLIEEQAAGDNIGAAIIRAFNVGQ